jgi:hypothetical protein
MTSDRVCRLSRGIECVRNHITPGHVSKNYASSSSRSKISILHSGMLDKIVRVWQSVKKAQVGSTSLELCLPRLFVW